MQVFELHFNPKAKEDLILDSFCYEPENIYEKRLGSLYIVGELKNVLPQNLRFLDNLARVIKRKYYTFTLRSPEQALKESLKQANQFLAEEVNKENVSWLGNLNLAVISLKNLNLNFTKVGNLKILLSRNGQISEISSQLESQEIEPYPLRVFSNMVSGKLAQDDKIIILTKEVFEFFSTKNLIQKIAKETLDEKKIKEILKSEEKALLEISGICLISQVKPEIQPKYALTFQKEPEKFSISQIFLPIFKIIKKISASFSKISAKIKLSGISQVIRQLTGRVKFPKLAFPRISLRPKIPLRIRFKIPALTKNLISILILILVLLVGFFLFKGEKAEQIRISQSILDEVESKVSQAENFLIFKDEKRANILLQQAWKEILPQTEFGAPLKEKAILLQKSIQEKLFTLNKLEKIEDPEILFEFKPQEINLIPQKILAFNENLYFYNPFSSNLYQFNKKEKIGNLLKANQNLKLGATFSDSVLFFSNPNILLSLKNGYFQEKILQLPSAEFSFNKFSSFRGNIYFLDIKSGEIAKYQGPLTGEILSHQIWLNPKTKKAIDAKSMTIDGSIWILTKEKEIDRYYGGFYRKTLKLNLFPYLKYPTKIWTSQNLPYLYLLESNRIIILTKKGEIVKQYQSPKFDNLLDFAVSKDGKIIYLLNGLRVYQIQTTY